MIRYLYYRRKKMQIPDFLIEKINNEYNEEICKNIEKGLTLQKPVTFRINTLKMKKSTAYDRISNLFKNNIIPLDKNYVSNKCPDISITTIERVLSKLVKENKIIKISMGRFTKYKWQNND